MRFKLLNPSNANCAKAGNLSMGTRDCKNSYERMQYITVFFLGSDLCRHQGSVMCLNLHAAKATRPGFKTYTNPLSRA